MSKTFFLDKIHEIVQTVLVSAWIAQDVPVSCILVADQGAGKTVLIKCYQEEWIHLTDSISSQGLFDIMQRDSKNEKKFIIIPDINPTLSRKPATANALVANLLSVTADGTVRNDDGRGDKVCPHAPVGLLTACTPDIYEKNAKQWFRLGLRRRIIPIFYQYTSKTIAALKQCTVQGLIHSMPCDRIPLDRTEKIGITLNEPEAIAISSIADRFAVNLGKLSFREDQTVKWYVRTVIPISPQVTLTTLAKAHAILRNDNTVNIADVDFVAEFVDFTNPESPRQI